MWNVFWMMRHFSPSQERRDLMIKLRVADRRDLALNCRQSLLLMTGRKWHHFGFFAKHIETPSSNTHTHTHRRIHADKHTNIENTHRVLTPKLVPSKYSHFKVTCSCQVQACEMELLFASEQMKPKKQRILWLKLLCNFIVFHLTH